MAQFEIDFRWPVDSQGYQLVEIRQPVPFISRTDDGGLLEMVPDERPYLYRDGQVVVADQDLILRCGGPLRQSEPLKIEPLWRRFADLDGSAQSCIDFASNFGYLGIKYSNLLSGRDRSFPWDLDWGDAAGPQGETLEDWKLALTEFRYAANASTNQLLELARGQEMAGLELRLVQQPPNGHLTLAFRPSSLLDALWLQMLQTITSGSDTRKCTVCNQWFTVGNNGRRRDARFCSPKCRNDFHNQRKKGLRP